MEYHYDLVVYIGRFQPKHKAHHNNTLQALMHGSRVLILIGSANEHPVIDNPFTYNERVEQFKTGFKETDLQRIDFAPIEDWLYDYKRWLKNVKESVNDYCLSQNLNIDNVALIGYDKDNTSFYLHDFPNWSFIQVEGVHNMSSTTIREFWYLSGKFLHHPDLLPELNNYFTDNETKFENRFVSLRMAFERRRVSSYGAISQAVDAIVTKHIGIEHYILLVRRKDDNTLALPGGFLDKDEELVNGAIRELREETTLDLRKFQPTTNSVRFAHPKRSQKGRVITEVFCWNLDKIPYFKNIVPIVKGGDDAQDALWIKISDLKRDELHDDHYQIIDTFIQPKSPRTLL
jgi:bifunctional NMN adenylyltransferase/nudix hydrolase